MNLIPREMQETCMAAPESLSITDLTNWIVTKHGLRFSEARPYAVYWKLYIKTKHIPNNVVRNRISRKDFELDTSFLNVDTMEVCSFQELLELNLVE